MSLEKDFDELLNDFIKSSSVTSDVSQTTGLEPVKLKTYIANDVKYRIPVAPRKPQYELWSIDLTYNKSDISSVFDNRTFVEPEHAPCKLHIDLCGVELKGNYRKGKEIAVAFYREGVTDPIFVRIMDPEFAGADIWKSESQALEPGKYFILVSNVEAILSEEDHFDTMGGCLRYRFEILPHGSKLKHPVVELEEFTCFKELVFNVVEASGSKRDVYGLYIYNSVGRLIERTDALSESLDHPGNVVLVVDSKEWWLDDRYTLVLSHNEQPFVAYSFEWSEEAAYPPVKETERSLDFFEMVKQTKASVGWEDFTRYPGYADVRRGLLDFLKNRKEGEKLSCAICSEKLCYDRESMGAISDVINPEYGYSGFDCEYLECDMDDLVSELESHHTVCLYNLSSLFTEVGLPLLGKLGKSLKKHPDSQLILFGNSRELKQLFELSPTLAGYIPEKYRWNVLPFTLTELTNEFRSQIYAKGLEISNTAWKMLARQLADKGEALKDWGREEVASCLEKEIIPRYKKRVLEDSDRTLDRPFFITLEEEDIHLPDNFGKESEFEESLAELNAMVGLSELKRSLTTTFNRTRFEEKRRQFGLAVPERGGHHMIFTGNPGTGKTTVAKLVGRIFHSMGLLSKGEVIEAERSKVVGRYIGETEQNMKEILEKAKGNVLFIDEAYSLCDNKEGDRKDYGCRILECLLTVLSQKNPDMIVIMAGYEKEMQQMLELNPGMKGRFPYKFNFEDYTAGELYQIAFNLLTRAEYVLTPEADALFRETIGEAVAHKDAYFHNARWVEQYVWDGVVSAMSDRVMSMPLKVENKELFQTIEVQDVRVAYQKMRLKPAEVTTPRRRIGFVA